MLVLSSSNLFAKDYIFTADEKSENDLTMDKKLKKKELAKHDNTIKDIEDSLNEVDEELRLRIQLLQKAIE